MWFKAIEKAHPNEIIVVAGKNPTLNVSNIDSTKRKVMETIAADTAPAFSPFFLVVCIVSREARKTSPKPRTILPSSGNVGITTMTGSCIAISFVAEATINLVMKTWKTSITVSSTANRTVVFHVKIFPEIKEMDRTAIRAKKFRVRSFQKKR